MTDLPQILYLLAKPVAPLLPKILLFYFVLFCLLLFCFACFVLNRPLLHPWLEDDNIRLYEETESSTEQSGTVDKPWGFFFGSNKKTAPALAVGYTRTKPPIRRFKWVVESRHFAPGFQTSQALQKQSPWSLCVRYLMDDLCTAKRIFAKPGSSVFSGSASGRAHQIVKERNACIDSLPNELDNDDADVFTWRDHQVTPRVAEPGRYRCCFTESKARRWGTAHRVLEAGEGRKVAHGELARCRVPVVRRCPLRMATKPGRRRGGLGNSREHCGVSTKSLLLDYLLLSFSPYR